MVCPMLELAVIPLCSLAYAYRGGRLGQRSGFIGRLAWFAAVGLSVWLLSENALYGLLSACGAFAGNMLSHGRYFTMGRETNPPNKNDWLWPVIDWIDSVYWRDAAAMFIIGTMRGICIFPPAALLFGIAHISAYEIGWRVDKKDGVYISEYVYGAFVGLILYAFCK